MKHPRFISDPERGTLTIHDVHLADEGNYNCVVNTTAHPIVVSDNAHLYVQSKSDILTHSLLIDSQLLTCQKYC